MWTEVDIKKQTHLLISERTTQSKGASQIINEKCHLDLLVDMYNYYAIIINRDQQPVHK